LEGFGRDLRGSFSGPTNLLINQLYGQIARGPAAPPLPEPPTGWAPPYRPGLPAPDVITPRPADTSYVRSAPLDPQQAAARMRPALPPGSFPTDASGVTIPDLAGQVRRGQYRINSRYQLPAGPQPHVGGPHVVGYESPGVTPEVTMDDPSAVRAVRAKPARVTPARPNAADVIPIKDPSTGVTHYILRPPKLTGQAKGGLAKSDEHLQTIARRTYTREAALRRLRG
jgi:hypothetical protein